MALFFPASEWNGLSYKQEMRQFGWRREKGARIHAGCDIYAPLKSDVIAIADGTVVENAPFYNGTYQISVNHPGIGIVRYGEILNIPKKFTIDSKVVAGEKVGEVGKVGAKLSPMLHIEHYDGSGVGSLSPYSKKQIDAIRKKGENDPTVYKNLPQKNYWRRNDLLDSTVLLDQIVTETKK